MPVQTWLCSEMLLSKSPFLQQVFTPAGHGRGFALAVSWCGASLLLCIIRQLLQTAGDFGFGFFPHSLLGVSPLGCPQGYEHRYLG